MTYKRESTQPSFKWLTKTQLRKYQYLVNNTDVDSLFSLPSLETKESWWESQHSQPADIGLAVGRGESRLKLHRQPIGTKGGGDIEPQHNAVLFGCSGHERYTRCCIGPGRCFRNLRCFHRCHLHWGRVWNGDLTHTLQDCVSYRR